MKLFSSFMVPLASVMNDCFVPPFGKDKIRIPRPDCIGDINQKRMEQIFPVDCNASSAVIQLMRAFCVASEKNKWRYLREI
jgi:hypothetical protein